MPVGGKALADEEAMTMKSAADVMTKSVVDIHADALVTKAIERMKERKVSSLLVRPAEGKHTWGFMTQTDVIEKVIAAGLDPDQVHVREIMSKPVITVAPSLNLQEISALFARADIRRVLVFDGEDMVGIVSGSDIFDAL